MSHTPRTARNAQTARRTVLTGCGVLFALVAVSACGGADTAKDGAKKPAASKSAPKAADGKKKAAESKDGDPAAVAVKGSGTFQVGKDVQPGTYRTSGNKSGDNCYWERAKDSSGELESTLANDNVTGTSYVTVKATDKIFKSSDCKGWEAVDPKATNGTPRSEFSGDGGMFKVGSDIAPGTYTSEGPADGGAGCYWERAKNADHELDSIIANENPEGSAVVTIGAKDAYFKTTGCTNWKKSS
ncbi:MULTISPECIES: hypothetical protein [unclassified Streptomyces]|uniref:hypothetical protein n=1 Tax=unclassified Streptomyces TaxID=2593676 RepID=UPI00224D85CA|nr:MULTISPECIES: hypothetical protein [unclassified Streptomyces]MCX4526216.1 hypothetical protein [Streptomyces sp. NBC_01551]MCX4543219.1 hypothetical protein [Streptomyces sp. NBC_01565]